MARSYNGRRSGRQRRGVLIREPAWQKGIPSNSLYSIPVTVNLPAALSETTITTVAFRNIEGSTGLMATTAVRFGASSSSAQTVNNVVRVNSVICSSKSPFTVRVRNSAGGFTTYPIPANKQVKITFSRETSIIGNAALLRAVNTRTTTQTIGDDWQFVSIGNYDDPVDLRFNVVVDSALD